MSPESLKAFREWLALHHPARVAWAEDDCIFDGEFITPNVQEFWLAFRAGYVAGFHAAI